MDYLDPKAKKRRNKIYGTIFLLGTIGFAVLYGFFLNDVGYDPSNAVTKGGRLKSVGIMVFLWAAVSSAVMTFAINIVVSIFETMFESKKDYELYEDQFSK